MIVLGCARYCCLRLVLVLIWWFVIGLRFVASLILGWLVVGGGRCFLVGCGMFAFAVGFGVMLWFELLIMVIVGCLVFGSWLVWIGLY